MKTTYVQKTSTVQKADNSKAVSILDASSQSEALQRKADMANNAAQRAEAPRPNNTGMPDNLKSGIESLSGFSMDDVRVHYNSSKPATVQALAYTQGTDIHVAPGQEKHLPHEAWHVAQQMAGRVSPTTNVNGMPVNDNTALEHEADVMGEKAVQCKNVDMKPCEKNTNDTVVVQRMLNVGAALTILTQQRVPQYVINHIRDIFTNNPGNGPNLFKFDVTDLKYNRRPVFHATYADYETTIFYSSTANNDVVILGIGFHSGRERPNNNVNYSLRYCVNSLVGRTNVNLNESGDW
jgi:hypothetical protein